MITARIHCNADDNDGIIAQLATMPRIGETISLSTTGESEIDLTVMGVNHLIKSDGEIPTQIEIVIFAQPI